MATDFMSFLNDHYAKVDELIASYYVGNGSHPDMDAYL